jgi:hypothetical protein
VASRPSRLVHIPSATSLGTMPIPACALAQTSREIRSECRPLHLRLWHVRVKWQDLGRFLHTFYPAAMDPAANIESVPEDLQAIIIVRVDGRPRVDMDMAPLLRMRLAFPTLNCRFSVPQEYILLYRSQLEHDVKHAVDDVGIARNLLRNPVWLKDIGTGTPKQLVISCSRCRCTQRYCIKRSRSRFFYDKEVGGPPPGQAVLRARAHVVTWPPLCPRIREYN